MQACKSDLSIPSKEMQSDDYCKSSTAVVGKTMHALCKAKENSNSHYLIQPARLKNINTTTVKVVLNTS